MRATTTALVVVATSPAEFHAVERLSRVLEQHAAVVVAYDDKRYANGTVPRCREACSNLEVHLVRIPLPTFHLPLWAQGSVRPRTFCGSRRHDLTYSATTRWRVVAPLALGLVYRYDLVGWTDTDVTFFPLHLDEMFPSRFGCTGAVDAVHTGIMRDNPQCETGIDDFWRAAFGTVPARRYAWYGNLVLLNSSYLLRIASTAFAWYNYPKSWRYRWTDQEFTGVLQLTNATVVDASVWRDRGYFVHKQEAPQHFRRNQEFDPAHTRLAVES